jgi:hypothetical protein
MYHHLTIKVLPHKNKMIISFSEETINLNDDGLYIFFTDSFLENLSLKGDLLKKTITYKFVLNNHERTLICPLIKNAIYDIEVIWPAFKLPFRKYPICIYLYAVILYLSSNLSMRKVCVKTRKIFGIEGFCHSTLSRSLKKLSFITDQIDRVVHQHEASDINEPNEDNKSSQSSLRVNPSTQKHFDPFRNEQHHKLRTLLNPILDPCQTAPFSNHINVLFYKKYEKFLL